LHQRWLTDQDQVVGAGEVFTEQAQFAQAIGGHEMSIVDDGNEHFAGAVDAEGLLDQEPFALVIAAGELDLEGFAEDAQGIQKGNEPALDRRAPDLEIRADERVGLPHFVGVSFGKSQAQLVGTLPVGLEQFVLPGQPAEGIGRNVRAV
jgi:hypothetical protein